MNTFSINRFWLTLKTELMSRSKTYVRMMLTIFITLSAAYMLTSVSVLSGMKLTHDTYMGFSSIVVISFLIYFYVSASLVMKPYDRKEQRIVHFMLPSSRLEKYIVLIIQCVFVYAAMFFVGALLADALQWMVFSIISDGNAEFILTIFTSADYMVIEGTDVSPMLLLWFASASSVYMLTVYLLGGMFFRRYAFIFTSLVVNVLFVWFVITVNNTHLDILSNIEPHTKGIFLAIDILLTLLSMANLWLAYILYSRMQVINNKWINI